MMVRTALERRIVSALDATPARIPILLGGCGSGRSFQLQRLRERLGTTSCQYVDVERTATTPERFLRSLTEHSPFHRPVDREAPSAREAFDATLAFLDQARLAGGAPATFLIDEALELRTFESFPGLRPVLRELLGALAASGNRFVLTTRYGARALRLLRDAAPRFEVIHMSPLTPAEVRDMLSDTLARSAAGDQAEVDFLSRTVHALANGQPRYVQAIGDAMAPMAGSPGGADPIGALTALLAPDGLLALRCSFAYELRLHRARGYGALKAILEILAQEEPLTLTEIAHRLRRTPGSTKDYLSWLEDVDLITARQKRYMFTDPLTRLWVRLYCRTSPPGEEEVAREVQSYALSRLPHPEPAMAMAGPGGGASEPGTAGSESDRGKWGIIEID